MKGTTIRRMAIMTGGALLLSLAALSCGGSGGVPASGGGAVDPGQMGGAIQGTPLALSGATSTLAGKSFAASLDGTGREARFPSPIGIATDNASIYVTDAGTSIRRIAIATGEVTTLAGMIWSTGAEDGTADGATFNDIRGIATDGTNLYVADRGNCTIRKVAIATGVVTTLAGMPGEPGGVDGSGTAARFYGPEGIATDGALLYVTDSHSIRTIVIATGEVATLAGTANASGDSDGVGSGAKFNRPAGIATDGTNLYVADSSNGTIRKIAIATAEVTTLAGSAGTWGDADGIGAAASFRNPCGVATYGDSVYVSEPNSGTIRKVAVGTGEVTTAAGSPGAWGSADGTGSAVRFEAPEGVATDGANLFVADCFNGTIRRMAIATGEVTTLAGRAGYGVDPFYPGHADGTGAAAEFHRPEGVATDGKNLYVADTWNHTIRKVAVATGEVTTLAGVWGVAGNVDGNGADAQFNMPCGVTTDGRDLYVADTNNGAIRRVSIATGAVTTLAGGLARGYADGISRAARFSHPRGITTDGKNLYVADSWNNVIRMVAIATGAVTTVAGEAPYQGSADSIGALAGFRSPCGITTDGMNLYVADSGNDTIRKVVIATGAVTTLAGAAGNYGSADGTGAAASFGSSLSITTDGANLYVADTYNHTIRKVVIATSTVSTLAGSAGQGGTAENVGDRARFSGPSGITTDGTKLYVADTYNNTIRVIR